MREFSLLGFVEHIGRIGAEMVVVEHDALERAAVIVDREAKRSVGHYQAQAGPFAAWEDLAESTQQDRAAHGYPDNEPELRTGEMRDSIEHVVHGREADIGSNSEILEWQELGTAKMPPRSILGGAAVRKAPAVAHEIGESVVMALVGEDVHNRRLGIEG